MTAEILHCNSVSFLFVEGKVKKITDTISDSNMTEVSECMEQQKTKKDLEINPKVFQLIQREIGEFEIIL